MFFVVRLIDANKHCVFPEQWIRDSRIFLEKFVNYSINSNQTHLCFWSSIKNVFGEPDGCYDPDFAAPVVVNFPEDDADCCFKGKLLKYFISFDDATDYMKRLRSIDPPVYNEGRLREQPLPQQIEIQSVTSLQYENSFNDEDFLNNSSIYNDSTQVSDSSISNVEPVELVEVKVEPELFLVDEEDYAQVDAIIESTFDGFRGDLLQSDTSDVLNYVDVQNDYYEIAENNPGIGEGDRQSIQNNAKNAENNADAENERAQNDDQNTENNSDDDVSDSDPIQFDLEDGKPFPLPSSCDTDGMVKRENDAISGNWSFNENVSTTKHNSISFNLRPII